MFGQPERRHVGECQTTPHTILLYGRVLESVLVSNHIYLPIYMLNINTL